MNEKQFQLPDTILFINGLTSEITKEVNFADVPETIRFAPNASGEIEPVVKIVEISNGNQRIIRQMGRGGIVLKSTVQFLGQ
jgi:hypothetical protein